MKRDDYIFVITAGFLTLPKKTINGGLGYFSQRFEMNEPAKKGAVSIAGYDDRNKMLNFTSWITWLHEQKIKAIKIFRLSHDTPDLPGHIANAFTGSQ